MTKTAWSAADIADQTGRRVVITGATSGIGKEAARVLAGKSATVIIGARDREKGDGVVEEIRNEFPRADISVRALDLASLKSIHAFADSIIDDFESLDVLINNAGIMMCPHSNTADGFEIQLGTNHLGHFALTGRLMSLLKRTEGSRIVMVSSMAHKFGNIDFADLNWESRKYDTSKAYGDSKLANLYFTFELARRHSDNEDRPIITAAHPGWTGTDLQRHSGLLSFLNTFFAQDVDMGALPTLRAGFDPAAESGDYFGPSGFLEMRGNPIKVESNERSHDEQAAKELWTRSEELTHVAFA